jgi:hypothetical protein
VNRYEGPGYDRAVAASAPELISFFAIADNPREPDVARDKSLEVDFLAWAAGPYTLVARELKIAKHYWMEPKKAGVAMRGLNTFDGIWQTDVLRSLREEIPIKNVGVLVSVPSSGTGSDWKPVAPAVLRGAGSPKAARIVKYSARLLSDTTLNNVTFKLRRGCDRPDAPLLPDGGSAGRQYGQISFPIDFTVPDDYAGLVSFELSYTSPAAVDSQPPINRYCFWHSSNFQSPRP